MPPPNSLFIVPVQVRRGPNCEMPQHLIGACVACFVAASDYISALKLAVERLKERGFIFEDVTGGKVMQLEPEGWDDYVERTWPEFPGYFPPQADMSVFLSAGGVFFGPFVAFERE